MLARRGRRRPAFGRSLCDRPRRRSGNTVTLLTMSTLPSRSFGSVGVAMVTPFTPEGAIDVEAAQRLAVSLVDDGADMILLAGTTGEAPTTHLPEKQTLLREVKDALAGRAMLVAGAGSNDTAHAVRIGVGSQEAGAQGLLINAPYYNRPSQEGVYQHIMAVVEATDLPVMIYDIPGRTGVKITDDTLARLAEHERVLAVKDATGDVEQGFERMEATGLEYYSGDDGLNFAWLTHGASGVVSVVAHADAHSWREMIREVDAGDLPGARAVAQRMRPLVRAIMGGGQGAVMAKEALALQGRIPSATVRLPLVRATAAEVAALRDSLAAAGLL
ncbi:4-hydroxy-tetrahydrodipicolinate synthase [Actinomyces ruminicola]|uniref:4-hydroxy-tetrahydrodipicolinate synthase n=2 Tax=Actinomyces ruminicola TaxID=332524 RepID=A0A1G9TQA5_9ACTO|nr:4-hydroxy-tetrahydrodipicolinate synthase [Actinomyces ruminicola]